MVLKNKGEGRWMKHLDLFSGIGGFALAADRVWENVEHTFCDNDPFCQEVLKKHWPNSKIYDDIRTLTNTNRAGSRTPESGANTDREKKDKRRQEQPQSKPSGQGETTTNPEHNGQLRTQEAGENSGTQPESQTRQELSEPELEGVGSLRTQEARWDLLTGGFPCQPFSQAGRRRGTEDDRYLWPEMLRVIKEFKPTWIIGENVAGIVNMVLEQVCLDLEAEGYEVQPIIIPAVSVNAPHRRDRVWIVANRLGSRSGGSNAQFQNKGRTASEDRSESLQPQNRQTQPDNFKQGDSNAPDTRRTPTRSQEEPERASSDAPGWSWERNWIEVATELCRVDDGVSKRLDRNPRLKALGNAIVPQVAEEIMREININ